MSIPASKPVADFKTDRLRDEAEMRETIDMQKYAAQVQRYADAVTALLGERPAALLVFLNVANEVTVVPLS